MKWNVYPVVLSLAFTSLLNSQQVAAEPLRGGQVLVPSGNDIGFALDPSGQPRRIHLRLLASDVSPPRKRRNVMPDGPEINALKQLIGRVDAGAGDYDAVQHGARIRPGKRPTQMTIAEIFRWIERTPGQPHAIGRYQFIPNTLRSLVQEARLDHRTRFSPEIQDDLADFLLADAGLTAFLNGRISRHRFMDNLARIWAAFPTSSGRSHYHGIAGNRAVISWAEFDARMRSIFVSQRG